MKAFRSPKQACARAAPLSESHEIVATTGDQPGGGVASARERNLTTIASLARDHASPQTNTFDRSHQGAEASPSVRFRDAHHTVTASQGGRAHPTSKPQGVAVSRGRFGRIPVGLPPPLLPGRLGLANTAASTTTPRPFSESWNTCAAPWNPDTIEAGRLVSRSIARMSSTAAAHKREPD